MRKSIQNQERAELARMAEAALESYLAAIDTIEKHAVESTGTELDEFRAELARLRKRIADDRSLHIIDGSRDDLERTVSAYHAKVNEYLASAKTEVQQILQLFVEATSSLSSRSVEYDNRFKGVATNLERAASVDDLRSVRLLLAEQVCEVRACVELMESERAKLLAPLQDQIQRIEDRLQEAERLATTDPLTELWNRREGQRRATEKLAKGVPVCLMLIDLNRFKWVNDRYGHSAGDQILKMFGSRIQSGVRSNDAVCRWGGDEFLVVMDCQLSDALNRSRALARNLAGKYSITVNGRRVDVEVSASIGVAQCQPHESVESAFERADAMLYQMKGKAVEAAVT